MYLSLSALLLHTSCHSEKEEGKEVETKFLVTSPIKMDTSITKSYVCQIKSINHISTCA